mgnify:CR=1 FL=1
MWLSFADSAAAELPAHFQTSLSGLPFRLPLSFGEPHTSPKKEFLSNSPVFPVTPVTPARKTGKTRKTGIFHFQFPPRVHNAEIDREWVLRGVFCANQASKSAVCLTQMRNLRGEGWCKKHPQGTLAREMCSPYFFLPKRLCANSLSGSTLSAPTSRLASESIALVK